MNPRNDENPPTPISAEAIQHLIQATNAQGGALLVDGHVIDSVNEPIREKDLEDYPTGLPLPDELEWRRLLCHWARRALRISHDEHPLCVDALDTLARFCAGGASYRDLAVARARLRGRVAAAGVVGMNHGCPNAAATLACCHACNPDLIEAIRLTKHYVRRTFEFCAAERRPQTLSVRKSQQEGA
jgi:hypothetical protein